MQSEEIDKILRGKALKIYLLLLRSGNPMGVREIQRRLNFSTPSLVVYHLNKLVDLGIVLKTENDLYYATELVKSTYLRDFIKIRGFIFPRFLFYSVFSTTALLVLLIRFRPLYLTAEYVFSVVILSMFSALMWVETYRFWRRYFLE
ncbi:MAG: ArsR family transcriptional regulator [Candidatus Odinarchaeota archaeon]|nr:ArsR family transcriptional regulator [Candidatus Odinarchaeota archaeon]